MTENKAYNQIKEDLLHTPKTWLITGAAGFIGSNLLEHLLLLDQKERREYLNRNSRLSGPGLCGCG